MQVEIFTIFEQNCPKCHSFYIWNEKKSVNVNNVVLNIEIIEHTSTDNYSYRIFIRTEIKIK